MELVILLWIIIFTFAIIAGIINGIKTGLNSSSKPNNNRTATTCTSIKTESKSNNNSVTNNCETLETANSTNNPISNIQKVSQGLQEDEDDYFDISDKYRDELDEFYDDWYEFSDDVQMFFEENFSISQRISKLEKCINKFDKIKQKFYNYGEEGIWIYESRKEFYDDCWKDWPKEKVIINTNFENYIFEFQDIEFCNYNFLTYLLNLYKTDTERQKEHLKQEKLFYEIDYYGGLEKYQEHLEEEKRIRSIRRNVTKLIKENEGILQSYLINNFEEDDKKIVRKAINDLYKSNKISKEKKGNSYQLRYLDKPAKSAQKESH